MKQKFLSIYPLYQIYRAYINYLTQWRYHRLVKSNSLLIYQETELELLHRELLSMDLFRTLQAHTPWLSPAFFPAGGAADHKLLYLLGRLLQENHFANILELGAGQTSCLLSAFAGQHETNVFTIEHDSAWAQAISAKLLTSRHRLHHCPLIHYSCNQREGYDWYDLQQGDLPEKIRFDLCIVDGPIGTARLSRIGFVEHFEKLAAAEWVVVWDDLQRVGDLESFALFLAQLKQRQVEFDYVVINGLKKKLGVVFTKKYQNVAYYF